MGLALSVLVFSIGVLEALSCLEHARQSYLPLDFGRKRRRLVLDLGSGTIRHRETRRSSEFQRDPTSLLRRLSRQLVPAEDEVCEELAAIWDRVEKGRVHSTEVRAGGEGSEAASRSTTPDTVIHVPEDEATTEETDIPLEEGFCPKCVDENFDLLASAAHYGRDVILGMEGACSLHDNKNHLNFAPLNKENERLLPNVVLAGREKMEKEDFHLEEESTPYFQKQISCPESAPSTLGVEVKLVSRPRPPSGDEVPDLAPHQPGQAIIDQGDGKIRKEATGSEALTTPDLEDRPPTGPQTSSSEPPSSAGVNQLSGTVPAQSEELPHESILYEVGNQGKRLVQIESGDGIGSPISRPKTLLQEVTEIVSEWLGFSKEKLDHPDTSRDETNYRTLHEKVSNDKEIDRHAKPLFVCSQDEQGLEASQTSLLKSKDEPDLSHGGLENIDHEDVEIIEDTARDPEDIDTNISKHNHERSLTKQETAKGRLQKQNNIDIGRINKHKEMLRTGTYIETDIRELDFLDEKRSLENTNNEGEITDPSKTDVIILEHKLQDESVIGYSHELIENNQQKEQISEFKEVEEETLFQSLVEKTKSDLPNVIGENISSTDDYNIMCKKEQYLNERNDHEDEVKNTRSIQQYEDSSENAQLEKTKLQEIRDRDSDIMGGNLDLKNDVDVLPIEKSHEHVQNQAIAEQDTIENKITEQVAGEVALSQEIKEQVQDAVGQNQVIRKQETTDNKITEHVAAVIPLSHEVEEQVQDTFAQNKVIEEQETIDNNLTEHVTQAIGKSQDNKDLEDAHLLNEIIGVQETDDNKVTEHVPKDIRLSQDVSQQLQDTIVQNKVVVEQKTIVNKVTEHVPKAEQEAISNKATKQITEEMVLSHEIKEQVQDTLVPNKLITGQETINNENSHIFAKEIGQLQEVKEQIQNKVTPDQEISTIVQLESKERTGEGELQFKEKEGSKTLEKYEKDNEPQLINEKECDVLDVDNREPITTKTKQEDIEAREPNEDSTNVNGKQTEKLRQQAEQFLEGNLSDTSKSPKEVLIHEKSSKTEKESLPVGSAMLKEFLMDQESTKDSQMTDRNDASQVKAMEPPKEVGLAERKSSIVGEEVSGEDPDRRALQEILETKERLKGLARQEVEELRGMEDRVTRVEGAKPPQAPGLTAVEDITSPDKAFWLIFSGEYTKAMSKDWHSGHFCCWQCDESLTGQRYVLRDDHPYCIKCYEQVFANTCDECSKVIGIDSKDLSYKDKHWHEACFLCSKCRVSLVDKQFGSKADKIYCGNCYDAQFASRCDGCGQIFRAGTKKMEYKTRQWHEQCFCCCVCKTAIGTKSFIPREQEIYCAGCYEEKFATRCVKCNKIITSGGVTYKNEPWHRECFTCTNCSTSLAGQRFTSRDEKPYCADCFGELFAKRCTSCCKPITGIGGTRFISFEDRHWHNDCFICASCKSSLVGRGFITDAEDILCTECAKQKLM